MKFINREKELALLEEYFTNSKKKLFPAFIYGIRRVGKTRLIRRFARGRSEAYFFVNSQKNSSILLREFESELREKLKLPNYVKLDTWESFFTFLVNSKELEIIIFDEFQNFLKVDKSVYGTLQKVIDQNEDKPKLLLFSGSAVGLIRKVFEDNKEPLFGRAKGQLILKQLPFPECRKMLGAVGIKDITEAVRFYSVFGGVPRYYVLIEDYGFAGANLDSILERFFFHENAVLEKEVPNILTLELGTRKATYYSICQAIATGHTKMSEIASYLNTHSIGISPFLDELVNRFELIEKRDPITRENSKEAIYLLKNNIFQFWFRFLHPRQSLYEIGDFKTLNSIVSQGLNSFMGRGFEQICREWVVDMNLQEHLPFRFQEIGNWWHKDKEIDIIALNRKQGQVLFGEVKWKDGVDSVEILNKLHEKKEFFQWQKGKRKEHFAIFAKSFKKKTDEAMLFDLKDMARWETSSAKGKK
jgi:hypothetical protein